MKKQMLLGLCLGGCLIVAGPAAMADDTKSNNRSDRAVQVHIDKEGRKTAPDDSDAAAADTTTKSSASVSMIMPSQSQAVQHHADGSKSVQLGLESMNYLVVTVDENGELVMDHRSSGELDEKVDINDSDKGDK